MGNIPGNTTPTSLQNLFQKYGNIESVRVLSHKNCGFINFESTESAMAARDALLQNEIGAQGFASARVGFAKIPPPVTNQQKNPSTASSSTSSEVNEETLVVDTTSVWQNDLFQIMTQFNVPKDICLAYVKGNFFYSRGKCILTKHEFSFNRFESLVRLF